MIIRYFKFYSDRIVGFITKSIGKKQKSSNRVRFRVEANANNKLHKTVRVAVIISITCRLIVFLFRYIHVSGVFPMFRIHYQGVYARVEFVNILNPTRAHTS